MRTKNKIYIKEMEIKTENMIPQPACKTIKYIYKTGNQHFNKLGGMLKWFHKYHVRLSQTKNDSKQHKV